MSIPFKSEPSSLRQHQLFPSNIFDLLPEDHDCFVFKDLLNQLDTSSIEELYSPNGQHIVSASNDNTVRVWDANSGDLLHTLDDHAGSVASAI